MCGSYYGIDDHIYWSYAVVSESSDNAWAGPECCADGCSDGIAAPDDSAAASSDDPAWSVPVSKYVPDGSSGESAAESVGGDESSDSGYTGWGDW